MQLRELTLEDSAGMLEWFRDENVTSYLHGDYSNASINDAIKFISEESKYDNEVHYAIVNDENDYIGTVSLRHIDKVEETAELAIVVKSDYFAKGYAWFAVCEILKYAFNILQLRGVYWRVYQKNKRAIHFFDKHGFNKPDEDIPKHIKQRHSNEKDLIWYVALNGDDFENKALSRGTVAGCRVVRIKTIPTVEAGELSFFEAKNDISFDIKRIYYISKVPEGTRRGFHAHKALKQLLFCPYGKIQLILENENGREEIELSDPSIGVVIEKPTWREMLWMQKDSVLCVAASEYYKVEDYIRDYNEFKDYICKENREFMNRKG